MSWLSSGPDPHYPVRGLSPHSIVQRGYHRAVFPVVIADLGITEVAAGWVLIVIIVTQVHRNIPTGIGLDRVYNRRAVLVATALGVPVFTVAGRQLQAGSSNSC